MYTSKTHPLAMQMASSGARIALDQTTNGINSQNIRPVATPVNEVSKSWPAVSTLRRDGADAGLVSYRLKENWDDNLPNYTLRVIQLVASSAAVRAALWRYCLGVDLVGVDLLPTGAGEYVVVELNGAVDFTSEYNLDEDVFAAAVTALLGSFEAAEPEPAAAGAEL